MAETEYERYLRTDELLSLQKPASEQAHPDELQFQVVHQVSELWMKLIGNEVERAATLLREDRPVAAALPLERALQVLALLQQQLSLLHSMNPWDYHAIRVTLGRGSGLDSPGYRQITAVAPTLWQAFEAALGRAKLDLETVYTQAETHAAFFRLAEALISYDEGLQRFRYEHLRLTQRTIGPHVLGTGGMAVREMERGLNRTYYPALWALRDRLTEHTTANDSDGEQHPQLAH